MGGQSFREVVEIFYEILITQNNASARVGRELFNPDKVLGLLPV